MNLVISRAVSLGLAGIVALALASVPAAAASAPAPAPTLTMTEDCGSYPPAGFVVIEIGAVPGIAWIRDYVEWSNAGDSGHLGPGFSEPGMSSTWRLGSTVPTTYTATVEWPGGALKQTKHVDCSVAGNDYEARVIVNKPTWATSGDGHRRRGFVVKVTNLGDGPFDVDADDVAAQVLVNGERAGTVKLVSSTVVKPDRRIKFRYAWRYRHVAAGADVEYSGCLSAAGDPNSGNDCGSHTTSADERPPAP